jgi:hypothetical protein
MDTQAFIQKISVHMFYVQPKRDFYSRELALDEDLVEAIDQFNQNQAAYQEWLGQCYNTAEGRARSNDPQPTPPAFLTEKNNNECDKPKRVRGKGKAKSSEEKGEV